MTNSPPFSKEQGLLLALPSWWRVDAELGVIVVRLSFNLFFSLAAAAGSFGREDTLSHYNVAGTIASELFSGAQVERVYVSTRDGDEGNPDRKLLGLEICVVAYTYNHVMRLILSNALKLC